MRPDREFSDIVGQIYDCALDTSLWPVTLGGITNLLGGVMADLVVSDPLNRVQALAATFNWPDELQELAVANAQYNPGLPLGLTAPLGHVFVSTRDLDIQAFHRSLYWQTCFAGRGLYDYIVTPIARSVTTFSTWGVIGGDNKGPFTDEDIELARLLSPHIKRAIDISGALERKRVEAVTLRAALDALTTPALIVDQDGTIQFRNVAADTELATKRIFLEKDSRLRAVSPEGQKLLALLADSSMRKTSKGLDAFLTDAAGRSVHLTWAELERAGNEMGSPILILLKEPEAALTTPIGTAARLYRLTTSEIQVLGQVLHGRTLAEMGEILGLARSTVKTHLDGIYRKTQTNRQAELVSRVMSLSSPIQLQK